MKAMKQKPSLAQKKVLQLLLRNDAVLHPGDMNPRIGFPPSVQLPGRPGVTVPRPSFERLLAAGWIQPTVASLGLSRWEYRNMRYEISPAGRAVLETR